MLKLRLIIAAILLIIPLASGCSSPPQNQKEPKTVQNKPPTDKKLPSPDKEEKQRCMEEGEICVVGAGWDKDNLICMGDILNPADPPRCRYQCNEKELICPEGYGCVHLNVKIDKVARYCLKNECSGYSDTSCGDGKHCIQKKRESQKTPPPFTCEALPSSPVDKGGKCSSDSECNIGLVCAENVCRKICQVKNGNDSCGNGEKCVGYDNPLYPSNEELPEIQGLGLCTEHFCNPREGYICDYTNASGGVEKGTCKAYSKTTGECLPVFDANKPRQGKTPLAGDPSAGNQRICQVDSDCNSANELCAKTSEGTKYCAKKCPLARIQGNQAKRDAVCGDPGLTCVDPLTEGGRRPTSGACLPKISRGICEKESDCGPGMACVEMAYGTKFCMRRCPYNRKEIIIKPDIDKKFGGLVGHDDPKSKHETLTIPDSENDKICNPNGGNRYTCVKAPDLDTGSKSYYGNEGICVESCNSNAIKNGKPINPIYQNECGITGLRCIATPHYGPICMPPLRGIPIKKGGTCIPNDPNTACEDGYYCDKTTQSCQAQKAEGVACETSAECVDGSSCKGFFSSACTSQLGQPCSENEEENRLTCAKGLVCLSGTCVDQKKTMPGSKCSTSDLSEPCSDGEYCDPIGTGGRGICRKYCQPQGDHLTCAPNEFCDTNGQPASWNLGFCRQECGDHPETTCPDFQKACSVAVNKQLYCSASGTLQLGDKCRARINGLSHKFRRLANACAPGLICATPYDLNGPPTDTPTIPPAATDEGTCVKTCNPYSLVDQGCGPDETCSLEYSAILNIDAYTGVGICRSRKQMKYVDGKVRELSNPDTNKGGEDCEIADAPCGNSTLCLLGKCIRICPPGAQGDAICSKGTTTIPGSCTSLNKELFGWGFCPIF